MSSEFQKTKSFFNKNTYKTTTHSLFLFRENNDFKFKISANMIVSQLFHIYLLEVS